MTVIPVGILRTILVPKGMTQSVAQMCLAPSFLAELGRRKFGEGSRPVGDTTWAFEGSFLHVGVKESYHFSGSPILTHAPGLNHYVAIDEIASHAISDTAWRNP